jgi:hypothetical protein
LGELVEGGPENVLKRAEALGAKFVAVADKKGALELPYVVETLLQVHRNERLARAGGQRE